MKKIWYTLGSAFIVVALIVATAFSDGTYVSPQTILNLVYDATNTAIKATISGNAALSALTIATSITMSDDTWIGASSSATNITFDTSAAEVEVVGAEFGVGTQTPDYAFEVNENGGRFSVDNAGTVNDMVLTLAEADNTSYGLKIWYDDSAGIVYFTQVYNNNAGDFIFRTKNGTEVFYINAEQNIQVTSVDNTTGALVVYIPAVQASITGADIFTDYKSATGSEATVTGTATPGVIAYNTFTGSHYSQVIDKTGIETGMLLEAIDEKPVFEKRFKTVKKFKDEVQPNGENIQVEIGEEQISDGASDKQQLFKSRICTTKSSKAAIGVYGGTDNLGRDMILSIGTGIVIVANKGRDVEIGDFLESSATTGCVELQNDGIYRNSTVAKATQNIHWNIGENKRTISCVYLGG